jgi:glutathione-regulated potassium-efflux system protein KefB
MVEGSLVQLAVLLAVAAIAAPIARQLRIGSVLGYLAGGLIIGPYGLRIFAEVESILHVAEFGVILLLFLIGLELRPARLWSMRKAVFGLGGAQVGITAVVLGSVALGAGLDWRHAAFAGLALSLSSTALVLQVLKERKELELRHGRMSFSVLLFQDMAAIPMIALVGLFAAGPMDGPGASWTGALAAFAAIGLTIVGARFVLNPVYRLIATIGVREAMVASVLLTVVLIEILMRGVGLSPALGAFIAGVVLADSEYRHEISADLAPFEGLLLGLFFVAVGMSLNLLLVMEQPLVLVGAAAGLIAMKALVLWPLGRWQGLKPRSAGRFSLALSQGGEFAFVLVSVALAGAVIAPGFADRLLIIVTLSMIATPILLFLEDVLLGEEKPTEPVYDDMPKEEGHVIIAGFGRFGQIVARVLAARRIPFTALDTSARQVDFVRRFGNKIYYGDPSRLDILEAAQVGSARGFVLAIDDVEASLRTAALVTRHYPHLPVYARARDRQHVHRLMDLGVKVIERETFLSALELSEHVLRGLGLDEPTVRRTTQAFAEMDRRRLFEDYQHATDAEKLRANAMKQAEELEELFRQDAEQKQASAG